MTVIVREQNSIIVLSGAGVAGGTGPTGATGSVSTFTSGGTTVTAADIAEMKRSPINVKHSDYGAVGDGSTNDTAAFNAAIAAAGVGGKIFVPPGNYRIGDVALRGGQTIYGVGEASTLTAKTGATYVLSVTGDTEPFGNQRVAIRDLTIDGNGKVSSGVLNMAGTTKYNSMMIFDHLRILNALVGVNMPPGPGLVNEVDRNTFINCQFGDCTTGFKVTAVNSQEQELINCTFDNCLKGMDLSGSGCQVRMVGGGFSGSNVASSTCFYMSGPTNLLVLQDIVTENYINDIVCTTSYPELGVYLEGCIMQGTDYIIDPGTSSSMKVIALLTQFNIGKVGRAASADFIFHDKLCTFNAGATYIASTYIDHRQSWTPTGFALHDTETSASGNGSTLTSSWGNTPFSLIHPAGAVTAPMQKFINGTTIKSQINSGGEHVSNDATKGIVLKDAQATPHYWRVTISNAGALVITDIGTTIPP